jgi:acetyltransferase
VIAQAHPADPVAPYSRELVRTVELRGGRSVRIRPIRPDDEPRLVDLYEHLSRASAYQRFFTLMRHLPSVDYVRRLALVAERETVGGVQLIEVGRYSPRTSATAELAFVVEDGWPERALGAIRLEAVLDAAAARGIEQFRADVLADNHRMLRLFTSRTRVEHRITESGVTALRLRRADAGAPPRPARAG